jgi:hypothetical protein
MDYSDVLHVRSFFIDANIFVSAIQPLSKRGRRASTAQLPALD